MEGASRSSDSLSSPVERLEIDVVGGSPPGGAAGSGEVFFTAPVSSTVAHAFAMAFSSASPCSETVGSSTPMPKSPVYVSPSPGIGFAPSSAPKLLAPQTVGKKTPLLIASSAPMASAAPPTNPAIRKEAKNPLMVLAEAAALLAGNDD